MRLILVAFLLMTSLHAEVLKRNEQGDFVLTKNSYTASELLHDYAKLEGLNINVASDFQDESFTVHGNLKIPRGQIHKYVSAVMARSRNALIRFPESSQVQVLNARDTRYTTLPVYSEITKVPETDDHVQFSYTLKHIEASALSRNMRPFLSQYGRVIDMASSNSIHFTDSGKNIKRMVKIAQFIDTEEMAKSKIEIDQLNEKHKINLAQSKSLWEIVSENNGIFIIIFLLIGLILGFGVRGYMMKKVEGGW